MAHAPGLSTTAAGTGAFGTVTMRQWYVLAVLTLIYGINIADRYVFSTVMEKIRLDLQLTDGQMAWFPAVLAMFYVTVGFPVSALADRANRRNILAVALVLWSGLTVLTGLSRTFVQMIFARIGVGIGESGGTPPSTSMLADTFPPRQRNAALTMWALGAPLGAWLGADFAGQVADLYGWRHTFLVMGAPGVLIGVLIFLTIREPQRGALDTAKSVVADEPPAVPMWVAIKTICGQSATIHLMMGGAVTALWGWGLMWFAPTYLQRAYHLTAGEAGAILGPMHVVAGTLATLGTGALMTTRWMADPKRVLKLMAIVVAVVTVPSFVVFWTSKLAVAKIGLWILVPALYFYIGPSYGLISNTVQPQMRATAAAVTLLIANIANLVIAPQFVGRMSDYLAQPGVADASALRAALLMLAPTGLWAAWHFWAATHRIDEEAARVSAGAY